MKAACLFGTKRCRLSGVRRWELTGFLVVVIGGSLLFGNAL